MYMHISKSMANELHKLLGIKFIMLNNFQSIFINNMRYKR